eukprot:scaffold216558_cov15-Tisochrysis_lutea.AAC.1
MARLAAANLLSSKETTWWTFFPITQREQSALAALLCFSMNAASDGIPFHHSPSSNDLQYLSRKNMWNTKSSP